jgi:N-acetylmuramoyl-L-alanine amidase
MRSYGKILFFTGLQLLSASIYAQQLSVNSLLFNTTSKQNRMIFDVTASPQHRVFVMDNPSRLVIDISNAQLGHSLAQPSIDHPLFKKVRVGVRNNADLRIVVDLKAPISAKNFSLNSNNTDAHRLIVNLDSNAVSDIAINKKEEGGAESLASAEAEIKVITEKKTETVKNTQMVIAIDPGHGGNDPGAHGIQGTEEKIITFAIAKKLEALINAQSGMRAVMVRSGDYYVGLRERMQIARAAKADLFISIHADAFQDTEIKGASVYTLSTNGASSEAARWLADSANASDMVGVSLHDKEDDLASTLFDLTQKGTREASVNAANHVLKSFINISQLHKDTVQKAGFMVLKSPDIPSILVETAFISNASEEQNLLSKQYQSKVANAIFSGVRNYFKQSSPLDSRIAALDL